MEILEKQSAKRPQDKPTRVLVVDDSRLMREQICDILADAPGYSVVGTACNGAEALIKAAELRPDIMTLDVTMPCMDGLETLDVLISKNPIPVLMVSALTHRAADITIEALQRGAVDYVTKPEESRRSFDSFRHELLGKLRIMTGIDVRRMMRVRQSHAERTNRRKESLTGKIATKADQDSHCYDNCCVALGISTGGPPALSQLFQDIAPPLPPIVIVQHMPAKFTKPFAARLNLLSDISVKEAATGDVLRPNQALVAPGGLHLRLHRQGSQVLVRIEDGEPVSSHKPSVDVMMRDAAKIFGQRCLGVIMTGMGQDGAAGCGEIRAGGGYVLGQDEATSDVYGMNKVAFNSGFVDRQFSLGDLPDLLQQQCRKMFRAPRS
ncbi:MAG: chemotaxis response regulator protein-glutamate methylesterase [Pirellulales bacterium]|nr:chemotaxis response regulator protein-glutamate methylesterase [Pirellulales bacterium]